MKRRKPFSWRWWDTLLLFWPPGWLALLNRHWNHHHRGARPPAWRAWESLFFLLPFGFYLAWGLRWIRTRLFPAQRPAHSTSTTAECPHCGSPCVDELIVEREYPYRFSAELLVPLGRRYFRAEFHGLEKISEGGPTLIYMNHAGMAFPWDFLILGGEIARRRGPDFWLRGPGEKVFSRNRIFNYILPERWLETVGGVEATFQNIEKLFRHGHTMLYAPEGAAGMGKGWHRRYRLQRFHTSFVKLAAKYGAKLVPAVCLGGENLHPLSVDVPPLARLLGFPFFGISPLAPFVIPFPSMLVWSVPAKLRYHIFDPIELPDEDYERYTDREWQALADRLRLDLQGKIDGLRG
jgi:1-acyl-sn-glycerol-3-phosphate acyltransferase